MPHNASSTVRMAMNHAVCSKHRQGRQDSALVVEYCIPLGQTCLPSDHHAAGIAVLQAPARDLKRLVEVAVSTEAGYKHIPVHIRGRLDPEGRKAV